MKQNTKIAMLIILVLVAAGVFYFDSNGGSVVFRQGVKSSYRQNVPSASGGKSELRRWKLDSSRRTEYQSSGRDLFSQSLPPAPVQKKPERAPVAVIQQTPEPPPPALPANMKFFGYGTVPNGTSKRAFLSDGEEVL